MYRLRISNIGNLGAWYSGEFINLFESMLMIASSNCTCWAEVAEVI